MFSRRRVARTTVAAAAATLLLSGLSPQAGAADQDRGWWPVTGTYSSGADHIWQPLPPVRDTGAKTDASVVIDPGQPRQRYSGMGFSLDETSVSNLWKLTPENRDKA